MLSFLKNKQDDKSIEEMAWTIFTSNKILQRIKNFPSLGIPVQLWPDVLLINIKTLVKMYHFIFL